MFVSKSVHSNHADLIHDVAYDFYGRRMATCSSDQTIKIWDLHDDQEWECTARWRQHLGSVWRVCWAHPEFGQVIATCSFDRTIAIWEEITRQGASSAGDQSNSTNAATAAGEQATTNPKGAVWVRRSLMVDPRTSVTGLAFAPRFLGLQLAAICTDGTLLVYEAQDVMNLCQWTVQGVFATKMTGSCVDWSQSRLDPPLLAVGSAALSNFSTNASVGPGSLESTHQQSASTGKLVILEYNETTRCWNMVEEVVGVREAVYDVAFAPSMGQSFHTLAVASDVALVLRIRQVPSTNGPEQGGAKACGAYDISVMARLDQHGGRVSRVAWNFQGSILATAGDDGTVRLWCSNYLKLWLPLSVIRAGETSAPLPSAFLSAASAFAGSASSSALDKNGTSASAAAPPVPPSSSLGPRRKGPFDAEATNQQPTLAASIALLDGDSGGGAGGLHGGLESMSSGELTTLGSDASLASSAAAAAAGRRKPVRFKKSGSMITARNQVVWH